MKSGIYKIENKVNGKVYVGSSCNIKERWQKHRALLRYGKHQNSHLQAAWSKYGEDNFVFSIIELCPIDQLLSREQYFIDCLSPAYNQTTIAGKVEMTEERKDKISESVCKSYKEGRLKKSTKVVYQYDLKGNYLHKYNSLTEASKITGVNISNLSEALNGKVNIAGGYVWRFYKVEKLNVWFNRMGRPITKEPYRKKNRVILVYKENEVLTFSSTEEAVNALGCTKNQLYKALSIGRLLFNKFKVNYGEDTDFS